MVVVDDTSASGVVTVVVVAAVVVVVFVEVDTAVAIANNAFEVTSFCKLFVVVTLSRSAPVLPSLSPLIRPTKPWNI